MVVSLGDIGRVGEYQVVTLTDALQPVAKLELDLQAQLCRILACHSQRRLTAVQCLHVYPGAMCLDRQSYRAAAGAKVKHIKTAF